MTTQAGTTYQLEGRLLEVCSCGVMCPCWVGADPDGGTCDAAVGWHIDTGTIQGIDVSGLTIVSFVRIVDLSAKYHATQPSILSRLPLTHNLAGHHFLVPRRSSLAFLAPFFA